MICVNVMHLSILSPTTPLPGIPGGIGATEFRAWRSARANLACSD